MRTWSLSPAKSTALGTSCERCSSAQGRSVTIVVATKHVDVDDMQALADAGVEVVGENRAQELEAKLQVLEQTEQIRQRLEEPDKKKA